MGNMGGEDEEPCPQGVPRGMPRVSSVQLSSQFLAHEVQVALLVP